jgi:hypothetical protein
MIKKITPSKKQTPKIAPKKVAPKKVLPTHSRVTKQPLKDPKSIQQLENEGYYP